MSGNTELSTPPTGVDSPKGLRWPLAVIVLLISLLTIVLVLRQGKKTAEEKIPTVTPSQNATDQNSNGSAFSRVVVPLPAPFPKDITLLPISQESLKLNRADSTPQDDLQLLEVLLEGYRRALKENPSGENGDIVSALLGKNPSGVAVLPANHPAVTADGQLRDRWGTPYFFHPVSSQAMEIISAGPDQKLWTEDDIVLK